MAGTTRVYFVTDLHGSSKCFRKFINAAPVYRADVLILGGDLAGKALQTIVRGADGRWHCTFVGTDYVVDDGTELVNLERLIEDHGYYPYRAEPGELETRRADGSLDRLFAELMADRLTAWLELADERLRPVGTRLYFMLGNDDPIELLPVLDRAPWGVHAEGRRVPVDDRHEMISWGFSNITPWHSHREQTEEQLAAALEGMASEVGDLANAIVNVHVPPYGTQLDEAPVLDADLRVVQQAGQVKFAPVGSTAVRDIPARGRSAARAARPYPRVVRDPTPRPDDRHQPGQRLHDRDPQRRADHARPRQGQRPPARARLTMPTALTGRAVLVAGEAPSADPRWRDVLVAVDVGTSGARAVALDLDGRRRLEVRVGYPTTSPQPGRAEQDPRAWRRASLTALSALVRALGSGRRVHGIGLTGQCPSVCLVDRRGRPIGPGLIYRDNRAVAESDDLRRRLGDSAIHRLTGHLPSAFHVGPKLAWLRRHEPAALGGRVGGAPASRPRRPRPDG